MADKARVLVVANRTAESPELLDALQRARRPRARASSPCWCRRPRTGSPGRPTPATPATRRPSGTATAFLEQLRDEGLDVADAKVGDGDPLAAISDECNFTDYDELIVSTLPLRISKWLHLDLPRKARGGDGPAGDPRRRERGLMELEEREGVDPVIERRCAECGAS